MKRRGTVTEPGRAMRPRSLRSMSTIMTFSARSFSERTSPSAMALSSPVQRPRGAVPFMGRERTVPPSRSKNISGEAQHTAKSPVST